MTRPIRRLFQKLAYILYARRRLIRDDSVEMMGFRLRIPRGVFHPLLFKSSSILASHLAARNLRGLDVLDMGSGSGILSLVMARSGARVTAADINPDAAEATAANARMNGMAVEAHVSDLFGTLAPGRKFDLIVWNPPFYSGTPENLAGHAWRAGDDLAAIKSFAAQARDRLAPGGALVMSVSTEMNLSLFRSIFAEAGWNLTELFSRRWLFERFHVYEIRPIP